VLLRLQQGSLLVAGPQLRGVAAVKGPLFHPLNLDYWFGVDMLLVLLVEAGR